jgi:ribosome-associated protein
LIQAGEVRINSEVETRRGRKLKKGDVVEVGDRKLEIW